MSKTQSESHFSNLQCNLQLWGQSIASGLSSGTAFVYRDILHHHDHARYQIEAHQVDNEYGRIMTAIEIVLDDLRLSAERVEQALDQELAEIFHTHQLMLRDSSLIRESRSEVEQEKVNAEQAVRRVFGRWEDKFRAIQDEVLSEKADDVADLGRRLLYALSGIHAHSLEDLSPGSVLVAKRLLPSDTVFLSPRTTAGIVLESGGPASHAALLAREMGIPTVSQLPELMTTVKTGDELIVNGDDGYAVINPDDVTREAFQRQLQRKQRLSISVKQHCHEPAVTLNGMTIEVQANINSAEDVELAVANGADAIGLYRIENLYLSRKMLPTDEELIEEIRTTLAPARDLSCCVRLLDIGGDKILPFLDLPEEDDPFLGRRGVRLLLAYPELLKDQLRALLRLSCEQDIRILVPVVTLASEMQQIRRYMESTANELGIQQIPALGAMIETPAAALSVTEIAKSSDFLSIGSNDLTQYTLAASRENNLVSDYFIADHPSLLRLFSMIVNEAGNCPVSICGQVAGELNAIPALLATGLNRLSVVPPIIPVLKQTLRELSVPIAA